MEGNLFKNENNIEEQIKKDSAETRLSLSRSFGDRKKLEDEVTRFIKRIDIWYENGMPIDKEKMKKEAEEGLLIQDKEKFIDHFMKILDIVIRIAHTQPKVYERAHRAVIFSEKDNFKLSDLLFAELKGEIVSIHLAEAKEYLKDNGFMALKREVLKGLEVLAGILKTKKEIKEVEAISWIVAKNPALMENLGFKLTGEASEEKVDNLDEKRPVATAIMSREDFLERYARPEEV